MTKKISILGSTGSIGVNTLNIARQLKHEFDIVAIAANQNIDLLEQQAKEFHPELIAVFNTSKAQELQKRLPNHTILGGMEGVIAAAEIGSAELVMSAMSGTMGLKPTIAAIRAKKDIALANKEVLVSGGELIMQLVEEHGVKLIPVDSEHSALYQCLDGRTKEEVSRLILTASGGPFFNHSKEQLSQITTDSALAHPNWTMGPKITIDSSTLMNKGLEVIEAHWLFRMPIEKIDVIIHPQSIIHSMVEFVDHSLLAQMGVPDMVIPIQYAMTHPKREANPLQPFDFLANHTLQFFKPNFDKFRCLDLAFQSIKQGGSLPCYMNAANECLVHRFLKKQIHWADISTKLETLMDRHQVQKITSVNDIFEVDTLAREEAELIN